MLPGWGDGVRLNCSGVMTNRRGGSEEHSLLILLLIFILSVMLKLLNSVIQKGLRVTNLVHWYSEGGTFLDTLSDLTRPDRI